MRCVRPGECSDRRRGRPGHDQEARGPGGDAHDLASENTRSRYIAIKEEQAEIVKRELNILWHDYFKPPHLETYPDLHTTFWNAAKQASACKTSVSVDAADELMSQIEAIHNIFWATKGREVPWYTAS